MFVTACLVAAVHAALSIVCLIAAVRRKNWVNENVVYLPFFMVAIAMACATVLSIPTVVCAMDGDWMFAFFGVIVLLSICMMTAYLNCVIRYDDEGFIARSFFGIKRACSYGEVEAVSGRRDRKIYFNGYRITVDQISIGADEFMDTLYRGHRKATGRHVPAFKLKWDPMNGHMEHPWGYFILWVAVGLLCASFPALVFYSMTAEPDPSEINVYNAEFHRYSVDGESLMLYPVGEEQPYEIADYKDYGENLPSPETLCSGERYAVGVQGNSRSISTLTGADGFRYITLELERQVYRDNQRPWAWLICVASVVGVYCCYLGIAVARHPERYSEFVRRLFYKDGYLI